MLSLDKIYGVEIKSKYNTLSSSQKQMLKVLKRAGIPMFISKEGKWNEAITRLSKGITYPPWGVKLPPPENTWPDQSQDSEAGGH